MCFLFIPNTTMCSPTSRPCFFHLSKSSVSSTLDADGVKDPAATDSHFISTQYIISFVYIQEQGGGESYQSFIVGEGKGGWSQRSKVAASGVQDVVLDLGVRGLGQVSLREQRQSLARTMRGLRYRQTDRQTGRQLAALEDKDGNQPQGGAN